MKYQVDLCDNVVTQRGVQLVCKSCYRFAHKERKRMVYVCHDANLDLKGIVTNPNSVDVHPRMWSVDVHPRMGLVTRTIAVFCSVRS